MYGIRKHLLLLCLILCAAAAFTQTNNDSKFFQLPAGCGTGDYLPSAIIFKIDNTVSKSWCFKAGGNTELDKALSSINASGVLRKFPNHKPPAQEKTKTGDLYVDLSAIFECTYTAEVSIEKAINTLLATGVLQYAQPHYIEKPLSYIPDDPVNINQLHLSVSKFFDAWDIEKGDSNVVIGIVDGGVDLGHPDLAGNIKYNYDDTIDGIDNDNDGYTDNYMGWDMGCNDNNPQVTIGSVHGASVSGVAAAVTDNGIGVSGTGFNCRFLPLKMTDINNQWSMGYEGVIYAADHGCKVINCSWGNPFYEGPYAQDIINYAAVNCDAVVVAACGNANTSVLYYPASFDHVLSIAGTENTDIKWSGSSYGTQVDLCAQGAAVWTTVSGSPYYYFEYGTSFASPLVSGAAALLRSHFPSFSSLQIAEQLKVTCDVIDTIPANAAYADMLGAGRLNMYRALTDTTLPSVMMINRVFRDNDHDNVFEGGDTLSLTGDFFNYLFPSSQALAVQLLCSSPYVQLLNSSFTAGNIPTLDSVNNNSSPFTFRINASVPSSYEISFKLVFTDTNYRSVQYFTLIVNPDYITIDTNRIATTITSSGILGYNNMNPLQGVGFTYDHSKSLMTSGGFIIGASSLQVSDAILGLSGTIDHDFKSVQKVTRVMNPAYADFETFGIFNDAYAGIYQMHLLVDHKTLAWNDAGRDKFIILEFKVFNQGSYALNNLYAGYFVDWDVVNYLKNSAGYLPQQRTAYVYPFSGGTYTGIKLLSPGSVFHYAFDNNGANGSINIYDGFTGIEKYLALHTNRDEAGMLSPGNDVSAMVSTGPFSLAPGDSVEIAFALLAGDHLNDLTDMADAAQQSYNEMFSLPETAELNKWFADIAPNPFNGTTTLQVYFPETGSLGITISDVMGKCVYMNRSFSGLSGLRNIPLPLENLKAGVYYCRISFNGSGIVKKMIKL